MRRIIFLALLLPALAAAFLPPPLMGTTTAQLPPRAAAKTCRFINSDGPVTDVDVAGKLDPSRVWDVELTLNGVTKTVAIPEGTSLLDAAEGVFDDVPSLCRNGVCTTCAAKVTQGSHDSYLSAIESLSPEQVSHGFICCCQTYVNGPDLKILLDQQDFVYEQQYAKFEKAAHEELEKKKVFNFFA